MRFVVALFLMVIAIHSCPNCHAQNDATPGKTFGKSSAQIAAMGFEKWSEFYATREGAGTGTSADAADVFGKSLRQVNDQRIAAAALSPAERRSLEVLRSAAYDFTSGMLEIAAREGGTMWVPLRAARQAGVEELIAQILPLLRRTAPVTAARQQKIASLSQKITKGLTQAQTALKEEADSLPKDHDYQSDLKKARVAFLLVQRQFVRDSWPGRQIILQWFAARAEP